MFSASRRVLLTASRRVVAPHVQQTPLKISIIGLQAPPAFGSSWAPSLARFNPAGSVWSSPLQIAARFFSSTLKKRRRKMNKHKYKKRMKKLRNRDKGKK